MTVEDLLKVICEVANINFRIIGEHGPQLLGIDLGIIGLNQYMGPNNTMNLGKPKDIIESISRQHDIDYMKAKRNPRAIAAADQKMLKSLLKIKPSDRGWKWNTAYYGIKYARPLSGFGANKLRNDK